MEEKHFIILTDSVGQEFTNGGAGMISSVSCCPGPQLGSLKC